MGTLDRRDLVRVLTAAAVILVSRASLADHYQVPSGSMEPTLLVGDQICVNKAAYGLRVPATQTYLTKGGSPQRGDVVVLASPVDGTVLVKRIVAIPGDRVRVEEGRVWLNDHEAPAWWKDGALLEEIGGAKHALGTSFGGGPDLAPVDVPVDHYLVLGDNRGNSNDGRMFGWVERDAILGKAVSVCFRGDKIVWEKL